MLTTVSTPSTFSVPNIDAERAAMIAEARVMIVDDIAMNYKLIQPMLLRAGFKHVTFAISGAEAIDHIQKHRVDLILLDIMMPGMDGFQVCEHLRNMNMDHKPIVIMQTASADSEHKVRAFQLGACDYVVKPLDAGELIMRSIIHLERKFLQQALDAERKRMQNELTTAAELQQQLLPHQDKISYLADKHNVDIAQYVQFSSEMGGDLWGLECVNANMFSVHTIDFSGHGLKAALNTFRIHALTQEIAPVKTIPCAVLAMLNNKLKTILPTGQYATMFYATIDTTLKTFTYSTAGSALPFIVRDDGSPVTLEGSGLPLGCALDSTYQQYTVNIQKGDTILLYSDALFEQVQGFKESDVIRILREPNQSAEQSLQVLLASIQKSADITALADDLTLIVIKI